MKPLVIGATLLAVLSALLLAAWNAGLLDLNRNTVPAQLVESLDVPVCHPAQQVCLARGEGGDLSFYLQPPVRPLQPFEVVLINRIVPPADAVVVEFRMPGMMMGLNRISLNRVDGEAGRWQGIAMLPVCISGHSDWLAEVSVQQGKRRLVAHFPFVLEP